MGENDLWGVRKPRELPRTDDAKNGRGLVLKMTSALGGEIRHVMTPSPHDADSQPFIIEIGANERWVVQGKEPFHAFDAFKLSQDEDYYDEITREEQVLKCKRRMGRVLFLFYLVFSGWIDFEPPFDLFNL